MGPRHVGAIGIAAVYVVSKLLGCVPPLTAQDRVDVTTREGEEMACIAAHHGDRAAIDGCKAQVRAKWATIENNRFDGGF